MNGGCWQGHDVSTRSQEVGRRNFHSQQTDLFGKTLKNLLLSVGAVT